MKKILSILIAIFMITNFTPSALAEIQPLWTDTATITDTLSISDGTAKMSVIVRAYSNIEHVEITVYLEQYINNKWDILEIYFSSYNDYFLIWTEKYTPIEKGYKYRLLCEVRVYEQDENRNYILKETIERINEREY